MTLNIYTSHISLKWSIIIKFSFCWSHLFRLFAFGRSLGRWPAQSRPPQRGRRWSAGDTVPAWADTGKCDWRYFWAPKAWKNMEQLGFFFTQTWDIWGYEAIKCHKQVPKLGEAITNKTSDINQQEPDNNPSHWSEWRQDHFFFRALQHRDNPCSATT